MVLSKYDLISPTPYYMENVGHVKSVRLSEIDSLPNKILTYDAYTSLVSNDPEALIKIFELGDITGKSAYEIATSYNSVTSWILLALNFFFVEDVAYLSTDKKFVLFDKDTDSITGYITSDNFGDVSSVILQRCAIGNGKKKEAPRFKNKKARENYEKMYGNTPKDYADRENFDLGNIIAHLAAKGSGLNIINIWQMSVYNVYDQFMIARKLEMHDVESTSVAVWGDKDRKVDLDGWYKT